jgi:uncharacterized protein
MAAGRRITISAGAVTRPAELDDSRTARAIWDALPLEARANRWGDELYFAIPAELEAEDGREVVEVGDLGYWPPGSALCIFWGPTPASRRPGEIRPASPVNVFGRLVEGAADFGSVPDGAVVRIARAEG